MDVLVKMKGGVMIGKGVRRRVVTVAMNRTRMRATEVKLLQHKLRHPARQVDIIPGLKTELLISMAKLADADYMAVFDKDKVEIFDANNMKVEVTNGAILRG